MRDSSDRGDWVVPPDGSLAPLEERRSQLSSIQVELIDCFVHMANVVGVPRSLGEIYGFVFSSAVPVAFEDVVAELNISCGSASQGLRLLRSIGAIKSTYVPRDRRDHYLAETDLRKVVGGLLKVTVEAYLMNGGERLAQLVDRLGALEAPRSTVEFLEERVGTLRTWHSRARAALPAMLDVLEPREENGDRTSCERQPQADLRSASETEPALD